MKLSRFLSVLVLMFFGCANRAEVAWEVLVQQAVQEQGHQSLVVEIMCRYDSASFANNQVPNSDGWNAWLGEYLSKPEMRQTDRKLVARELKQLASGTYSFALDYLRTNTNNPFSRKPDRRVPRVKISWWESHRL